MEVIVIVKSNDGGVIPVTVKCKKFEMDKGLVIVKSKDIFNQVSCSLPKKKYQLIDIDTGLFLEAFDKLNDAILVYRDIAETYDKVKQSAHYKHLVKVKEEAMKAAQEAQI